MILQQLFESSTGGSDNYAENLAQQIFDKRQDISSEEEVLNQAYHIVANDMGQKTARYKFSYDADFPSDVVSNYFHLQKQGVTEDSPRVDSLVTDALKIMRGPTMDDAVSALKTVLGDREFSGRRGHYNFYVRQLMDMYGKQGVAEDYDDFDDEDEESGLRSGGYVRDKEDSSGEVFVMRGDPYDRRVQITDRNGSGWNISPSRLVAVDDSDPAIARYFGKSVTEGKFVNSDYIFAKDGEQWNKTIAGGSGTMQDPYTAKFNEPLRVLAVLMRSLALQMAGKDPGDPGQFGPTPNKLYYKYNNQLYMGDGTNKIMSVDNTDPKGVAEGEKDTSWMNKQSQDFYNKNPNFKRDDRETKSLGNNRLATRVSPAGGVAKVGKKPVTPFGSQGMTEDQSDSPVAGAITRRILMQRADLLQKYGPEKVMAAIDEVADFVGDVEEIGSSDVSGWVRHVEQILGNMEQSVEEGRHGYDDYGYSLAPGHDEGEPVYSRSHDRVRDFDNSHVQKSRTYHLVHADTGKQLMNKEKTAPAEFGNEQHARAVAAKLKYGTWIPKAV
jgi:hypothetical protein